MTDPRKAHDAEPTTHFGYKNVPESQKAQKVAEVFHSVAAKYDLMNDLMSGGIHRLWKRFTIELSGARHGNRILDIAGGTGDLTRQFSRIVGPTGEVVLADINASMLKVGRDKLLDKGVAGNVRFVGPMPRSCPSRTIISTWSPSPSACATSPTRKTPSPRCCACSSRAAGCWCWNSPSRPTSCSPGLRCLLVQPAADDGQADHQRLGKLPLRPNRSACTDQETLKGMMEAAGFERVSYHNMTGGIVALHRGIKP